MMWQQRTIEHQKWFHKANTILEIGAGGFQTALGLATKYPDKRIVGLDFTLSDLALSNLKGAPSNLTVLRHDARDLKILGDDTFDFVFSIAVMEHIHELSQHLEEVFRVVAPGGSYWFWQAPFWSSATGHHYKPKKPLQNVIPPYAHLRLNRDELTTSLLSGGTAKDEAESIVSRVHDRPDLSRLTRNQTRHLIEQSQFRIASWKDLLDSEYSPARAEEVLSRNLYRVSPEELKIRGAKVRLTKRMRKPLASTVSGADSVFGRLTSRFMGSRKAAG